jgi:hypothetical protein
MIVNIESSFEDYVDSGDRTTQALLDANGPLIQALRSYYTFFARELWADAKDFRPTPAMLAMNAFMLFLGGIRIAMTGHAVAIFPVLRTALESACYAFLMVDDHALEEIWSSRHKDATSRMRCRRKFQSAVRETSVKLNALQAGSGDWIFEAYESAIDFGAHPNARSVLTHVSLEPHEDDAFHRLSLVGLYGSESWETSRSLVACMDYGMAIAVVLVRCLEHPSQEIQSRLFELNTLKERVVANLMQSE